MRITASDFNVEGEDLKLVAFLECKSSTEDEKVSALFIQRIYDRTKNGLLWLGNNVPIGLTWCKFTLTKDKVLEWFSNQSDFITENNLKNLPDVWVKRDREKRKALVVDIINPFVDNEPLKMELEQYIIPKNDEEHKNPMEYCVKTYTVINKKTYLIPVYSWQDVGDGEKPYPVFQNEYIVKESNFQGHTILHKSLPMIRKPKSMNIEFRFDSSMQVLKEVPIIQEEEINISNDY